MTEIKIVNIEAKPWWKFWTADNLQVTVENGRGEQKTFTIYKKTHGYVHVLKKYIEEKYCTGDQFWSFHQSQKRRKKLKKQKPKTKKLSDTEVVLNEALELIGDTFDCALVLSREAEAE